MFFERKAQEYHNKKLIAQNVPLRYLQKSSDYQEDTHGHYWHYENGENGGKNDSVLSISEMDSSQLKSFSRSPESKQIDLTFKGHFNKSDKEDFLNKNKKIEINENLKKVKKLHNFPKLKSLLRAPGRNSRAGSKAKTKNEEAYKENSFISKILMP